MKILKSIQIIIFLSFANLSYAYDHNTSGYIKMSEIKAFKTTINVFFENGEQHNCTGDNKTRFFADKNDQHIVSFLLSAYMSSKPIKVAYSCGQDNYPWIDAVRIR